MSTAFSTASGSRATRTRMFRPCSAALRLTNASSSSVASCGYSATKLGAARCAMRNIINSIGDAEFGLMRFDQSNDSASSCVDGNCNQTANSGELLSGISGSNTATLLTYVDNDNSNGELCGDGGTPLGGALLAARSYLTGGSSPTSSDTSLACRPYNVILLTDGVECCNGCTNGGCPNAITDVQNYLGQTIACKVSCVTMGDSCPIAGHSETAPERAYEPGRQSLRWRCWRFYQLSALNSQPSSPKARPSPMKAA